jgi:hypothetical protein
MSWPNGGGERGVTIGGGQNRPELRGSIYERTQITAFYRLFTSKSLHIIWFPFVNYSCSILRYGQKMKILKWVARVLKIEVLAILFLFIYVLLFC